MGVVGHRTIGPDSNAAATAPFGHEVDVVPVVFVTRKCLLSTIPALRYMMWVAGYHDSRYACHECTVPQQLPTVNNLVLCPRIYNILLFPFPNSD